MKKRLLLLIIAITILISSTSVLAGCNKDVNLDKIGKNLSLYDINIVYNANNTVHATQKTIYKNNTGTTLDRIKFHLYPTAFSENATYKPVSKLNETSAYPNGVNYGTYTISNVSIVHILVS
jgi:hypothetical protein